MAGLKLGLRDLRDFRQQFLGAQKLIDDPLGEILKPVGEVDLCCCIWEKTYRPLIPIMDE